MSPTSDYDAILAVAEEFWAAGMDVAVAAPTPAGLSSFGVSNPRALPGLETSRFVPTVRFAFRGGRYVDGEALNFLHDWPSRADFAADPVLPARRAIEALALAKVPDRKWVRPASDCVEMLLERGPDGTFAARPVRFGDARPDA